MDHDTIKNEFCKLVNKYIKRAKTPDDLERIRSWITVNCLEPIDERLGIMTETKDLFDKGHAEHD